MRVSRVQAEENRQTVINVASRLFREHGFDGIGLKDLMKGVAKAWSEGLDGRGKRGSDALKEFDAAVAAIPAQ